MKNPTKLFAFLFILVTSVGCTNGQQVDTADNANSTDQQRIAEVQSLSQENLREKLSEEGVVLIDVRTPEEVSQGYIQGANHFIDFYDENFESDLNELDKSKTYVMYCRSGGRSGKAAKFMVANGFESVYNLEGGISGYTGVQEK